MAGNISIIPNKVSGQQTLEVTTGTNGSRLFTTGFIDGFTGNGWEIHDTGSEVSATVDNLVVRGRMDVYELLINQIRATNGALWVSSAGKSIDATLISGSN